MMPLALRWWNCLRGNRPIPHLMHCTLLQRSWRLGSQHTRQYAPSSDAYREKHRHYPVLMGRVAALEEEGVASADPTSEEDSESEVEAVDGLNMCLAQAMSCYQREEWKCFMCRSPGHFARDCPHHDAFKSWHQEQLNAKGAVCPC